ncbi:MAG: DUF4277 domain-containing protein [Lachnospiraceae bacterium]|nr:DUF4277 domain-containing protein [Lachnospiraceae bacterium]
MAKLQMKSGFARKLKLPLILTLAHSVMKKLGLAECISDNVSWDPDHWEVSPGDLAQLLISSTYTDMRIPLTHLEDRFEGIDVSFFLSSASKSETVNSFNAERAMERIGQSDSEKMYQVMTLSAIKQAGIPTERPHADTATISFNGEYDTEKLDLTDEERAELLQIERGYNKDGRPECRQVVENSFRELKPPSMVSEIYLKNPERIKALSMLLSLSLLIWSIIQYQMREGLKEFNNENPGVKLQAD